MKIVIIGGGPCGLGAAWRLAELGHEDWILCEKNNYWGGLSTSFQDDEGFWWDVGGHVLFSHYRYFDEVMDALLGKEDGWVFHEREAWIRMQNRFVPYPLQNNIHCLPIEIFWECLEGIIEIQQNSHKSPGHFGEWIEATFGRGIAKWFLKPYNYKVWAYPPEQLDWQWVGDRVAPVDLKRILKNAIFDEYDIAWGPNALFRFPRYGGTGNIWRTLAAKLPSDKLFPNREIIQLSPENRTISFADGTTETYDVLLNTIPLTQMVEICDLRFAICDCQSEIKNQKSEETGFLENQKSKIKNPSDSGNQKSEETGFLENQKSKIKNLNHSSTHIVGLALKGNLPENLATKCWIYFPENNCPFYRGTVFSNYSPNNVPDIRTQWSLMLEVSESPVKKVVRDQVVEDVIDGALNTGLLSSRNQIDHTWYHFVEKGYPTPVLNRNQTVFPLLTYLEDRGIYSRGRFGAWQYEVGNMDHCFMQGVEFVNHMLASGEELTLWYPNIVNAAHPSGRRR